MGKKITLTVLLILLIGAIVLQNSYVTNATKKLTENLKQIQRALEADDYAASVAAAETFSANWDTEKDKFEAFFEHKEVDTISSAAKSLQSLCISGSKEDALSHIAEEMFYITHIKDIDTLGWENEF